MHKRITVPLLHLAYPTRKLTAPSPLSEISQPCHSQQVYQLSSPILSLLIFFVALLNFPSHSIHISLSLLIIHLPIGKSTNACLVGVGEGSSPHQYRTQCLAFKHQKGHMKEWGTQTIGLLRTPAGPHLCGEIFELLLLILVFISTECLKEPKRQICWKTPSFHRGAKAGVYQSTLAFVGVLWKRWFAWKNKQGSFFCDYLYLGGS